MKKEAVIFRDLLIPRVIHLFWFLGSILLLRILIYYC
jgi:hypothetical protein